MITIDCSKAQSIKDNLLVHVADNLEALPILKTEKFILTPINEDTNIDKSEVLTSIDEFLESTNKRKFSGNPKGKQHQRRIH